MSNLMSSDRRCNNTPRTKIHPLSGNRIICGDRFYQLYSLDTNVSTEPPELSDGSRLLVPRRDTSVELQNVQGGKQKEDIFLRQLLHPGEMTFTCSSSRRPRRYAVGSWTCRERGSRWSGQFEAVFKFQPRDPSSTVACHPRSNLSFAD